MITKGIRGAITVFENTEAEIKSATLELMSTIFKENKIDEKNISHIIFSTTKDVNCAFPAKFARIDMGLKNTAMMCFHEMDVTNALKMCIRVIIVVNCDENFVPKFVYLKGAADLRK